MSWLSGRLFGPVLVLVLGMPMAAAAQTGGSWQIAPHAGVFLPLGGLGQVPISTQIAGAGPESREAKVETGTSLGVTFLRTLSPGTRLRLDLDYVPAVDVRVDGYTRGLLVRATGASVVAGVEKSLTSEPGRLEPFLAGGAGFRSYHFQPGLSSGPQFPSGQISAALRVGGGVAVRLSVVSLGLEVADQLSLFRFEADGPRRLQNDVHALLSVRIGTF